MKYVTRFLSLAISMILMLNTLGTASAATVPDKGTSLNTSQITALSEALYVVELQKDIWGLGDTDFACLRVGKPVQTYAYEDDTFEPNFIMYPIMNDDGLILWAIPNGDKFQITTMLIDQIRTSGIGDEPFTIIYDKDGTYLCSSEDVILLKESEMKDSARSVLNPIAKTARLSLQMTNLSEYDTLEYAPPLSRASMFQMCPVKEVRQSSTDRMCWAATVACIVNYRYGSSYSASDVAKRFLGETNYNRALDGETAVKYMTNLYGPTIPYQYALPASIVTQIINEIAHDCPVYAGWIVKDPHAAWASMGHASCIYGVYTSGAYISIMDPNLGFATASPSTSGSRDYYYYSDDGLVVTLDAILYHTW